MHLSVRQASETFAVSRRTLDNDLEKGVVSGAKDDNGNWQLDSAELMRVYAPRPRSGQTDKPAATAPAMPGDGPGHAVAAVPDDTAATIARLTAELAAEKELRAVEVAAEREKRELVERHLQDSRRLLPAPDALQAERRRSWWPW